MTPKVQTTKAEINKWDPANEKAPAQEAISKGQRQPTAGEKMYREEPSPEKG